MRRQRGSFSSTTPTAGLRAPRIKYSVLLFTVLLDPAGGISFHRHGAKELALSVTPEEKSVP